MSGIALPLFSVRRNGDHGIGDFAGLVSLFHWLTHARQRMVMLLPLTPLAIGDSSPYGTRSTVGFDPSYIALDWLKDASPPTAAEAATLAQVRASGRVEYQAVRALKEALLARAFANFRTRGDASEKRAYETWAHEVEAWLSSFAIYMAVHEEEQGRPFWEWPQGLAERNPAALETAKQRLAERIEFHRWVQWVAHMQWQRVRRSAQAARILLCGDEPFSVASDSVDCWRAPKYVRRDARLGVPPDDFSDDGQDWGLPWIDFEALDRDGGTWLKERVAYGGHIYDVRRVDHAIGYFRQYLRDEAFPKGHFVPGDEDSQRKRGESNFRLLGSTSHIFAEDLGVIPRFARDSLAQLGLPGYQVMRWAREDGVYRDPHHYPECSLVTTGTHDTDSLKNWWTTAESWEREAATRSWMELRSLGTPGAEFTDHVHEALIRAALNARSTWCILPWSDIFGITDRINVPGTMSSDNWTFRIPLETEQLLVDKNARYRAEWLARLTREAQRSHEHGSIQVD